MSEAAVAETETDLSSVATPESEGLQEQVSTETDASPGQGEETRDAGTSDTRTPDSYSLPELDQLYREGKLANPDLVSRRETLTQSQRDREQQEQVRLQQIQAAETERLNRLSSLRQDTEARLAQVYEAEMTAAYEAGRNPDFNLIKAHQKLILDDYHAQSGDVHLAPVEQGFRSAILRMVGDSVQNRRAVGAMGMGELVTEFYRQTFQQGQKAGPGEGFVVKSQKDYDAEIKKAADKAVDDFKATLDPAVLPSGTSGRSTGGLPSPEAWNGATYEQRQAWKKQYGENVADSIFFG